MLCNSPDQAHVATQLSCQRLSTYSKSLVTNSWSKGGIKLL